MHASVLEQGRYSLTWTGTLRNLGQKMRDSHLAARPSTLCWGRVGTAVGCGLRQCGFETQIVQYFFSDKGGKSLSHYYISIFTLKKMIFQQTWPSRSCWWNPFLCSIPENAFNTQLEKSLFWMVMKISPREKISQLSVRNVPNLVPNKTTNIFFSGFLTCGRKVSHVSFLT